MIGVDLFSGAGGMSIGAKAAGVDVRVAVECDPHAATTYRANHPGVCLIQDYIRNVTDFSACRFDDEVVVFGGPPCQGFSTSNQRNRSADNPNNWLFREFLRVISEVEPEWAVFENVRGILETEEAVFLRHVQRGLEALGYTLSTGVLNAVEFGVPQRRSRLFIIGSRCGVKIELPKHTVTIPVTVRDALSDLPDLDNGSLIDVSGYKKAPESEYARKMRGDREETYNHLVTRNGDYILERYDIWGQSTSGDSI